MMKIKNELLWLAPLPRPPVWTECEKRIIAWAVEFEGWITLKRPQVGVCTWHRGQMAEFFKVAKIGAVYEKRTQHAGRFRYSWQVDATRQIAYLLERILPYLVAKRERAERLLATCLERIREEEVKQ